jgi:hypothetical protein
VLGEIAGTSLDNGSEIDALAKLDEGEQRRLAERAKNGEKVSAKRQVTKIIKAAEAAPDPIKEAGAFHYEGMEWSEQFCARIKDLHAAHPALDEEAKLCVMQALEMMATRLFQQAQALDGR